MNFRAPWSPSRAIGDVWRFLLPIPQVRLPGPGGAVSASAAACTPAAGYGKCGILTIDHTQVASTLTSYPVFKSFTLGSGKITNSNCYDVVFTSDAGGTTKIPWEQEPGLCNSPTGAYGAHVLLASVSSSADTKYYVSYGNSGVATAQNTGSLSPSNVWDSHFLSVYHLPNGAVLGLSDSTSNAHTASSFGVAAGSGQIDGGGAFSNASLDTYNTPTLTSLTASGWFNWSDVTGYQYFYELVNAYYGPYAEFNLCNYSNSKIGFFADTSAGGSGFVVGTSTLSTGTWYKVDLVWDGSVFRLYLNNSLENSASLGGSMTAGANAQLMRIGNGTAVNGAGYYLKGSADELRLSNIARSAAWMAADYAAQKSGSTFVSAVF